MQDISLHKVLSDRCPFQKFSLFSNFKYWGLIVVLAVVFSSCSTKKNTFTRRAYHNLTAHYNGWWNGNESLKNGATKLSSDIPDEYSKILPVFNYGTAEQASMVGAEMDRAIEKGAMVAQRHSMWFRNREHCKWIDDSYLLIGKANFYKHEYTSARQSFTFIISRFYYNNIKSEAQLWLAKTFIETGNYQNAETLLDELSQLFVDEQTPFVRKNLDLVYADLFIKSKQYKKAIPYLEQATQQAIKRKTIARASYILAQLYQKEGNASAASTYYQKVVKINTNYQMAFNAKINLAFLYTHNSSDGNNFRKSLVKMLKDSKNKNYLDQIYYALADIDLKDNDSISAIQNLRKAVRYSTQNQTQKAQAALKAASLLFNKERYTLALNYYDTALQQLPENFEAYDSISRQASIYQNLSRNLSFVQTQDSLLQLGQLPDNKLNALADSLIAIVRIADELKRDEETIRQQNMALSNQMQSSASGTMGMPLGGGQWYFYNPQAKNIGLSEFISKWGNRQLADNWRLSNKQASGDFSVLGDEAENTAVADTTGGSPNDPHSRNYYLKDIPRSEEQIADLNTQIADALYQAAFIYEEDLKQDKAARNLFQEFTRRVTNHPKELQVYFQLFRLYDSNPELKNKYKELIIEKYPETDYAQLVQNPDYYREMEKKQNFFRDQYARAYQSFLNGQYLLTLHLSRQALEKEEEHPLKANFLYLKALSLAKTDVIDSLYTNLSRLAQKYPDAPIAARANEILQRQGKAFELNEKEESNAGSLADTLLTEANKIYALAPEQKQFVLVILDAEKVNVNATLMRIQDFNKKQSGNIKQTSFPLINQTYVISIGEFNNQEKAMAYYRMLTNDTYVFPATLRNDSKTFVISADNYSRFFKDKDIEKYETFFKANYPN